MNKYQEALKDVRARPKMYDFTLQNVNDVDLNILQELVDKATPKKVLNRRKSGVYVNAIVGECPNCGKFIQSIDVKPNQCECRQEIDWSGDNE